LLRGEFKRRRPGKKRLSAVQHYVDNGQPVRFGMLGDSLSGPCQHLLGGSPGATPPLGIFVFVDITVVTCEIASAVHL
jgi:hypothetical protein